MRAAVAAVVSGPLRAAVWRAAVAAAMSVGHEPAVRGADAGADPAAFAAM